MEVEFLCENSKMNLPKDGLIVDANHETYEFYSSGPKGKIKKLVNFTKVGPTHYNLGFGDWDESAKKIIDSTRSNNGDREFVLATVAASVVDFMKHHPYAIVFAEGETPAKTRLYQMGINSRWNEISQMFEITGYKNAHWEPFERTKNYEAFVLKAKQNL